MGQDNGKEIAQVNSNAMVTPEDLYKEFYPSNQFTKKILNANPNPKSVAVNKFANNSLFIPIGEIEMQLDELYYGLWQTRNFKWSVVANEICCSLELWVYHPLLKEWIVRSGAGAAMIQQDAFKKDENGNYLLDQKTGKRIKINPKPSDVDYKIKNTMVKDFPHAKAEALKNAAKSLGKFFGRDLNRGNYGGQFDDFLGSVSKSIAKRPLDDLHFQNAVAMVRGGKKSLSDFEGAFALTRVQVALLEKAEAESINATDPENIEIDEMIKGEINKCNTVLELTKLHKGNPQWHNDAGIMQLFTERKNEIEA